MPPAMDAGKVYIREATTQNWVTVLLLSCCG